MPWPWRDPGAWKVDMPESPMPWPWTDSGPCNQEAGCEGSWGSGILQSKQFKAVPPQLLIEVETLLSPAFGSGKYWHVRKEQSLALQLVLVQVQLASTRGCW